ncbi:MAG: P1 family peptidase [Candidatus Acidiferrales bacterium]
MNRRDFNRSLIAAAGGMLLSEVSEANSDAGTSARNKMVLAADAQDASGLTDVEGLKVGHFTDKRRPTGCTVILCEKGATGGVDVRGGAPGTRETDLLRPINTVQQVYGLALSGGSAFGLDTASGVMRYLDEKGIGYPVGPSMVVPIVPAAILFDLEVGNWKIRPTAESGYQACLAATTGKIAEGNVGAGAGATVGKMFGGKFAMKGGLGTASIHVGNTGVVVAAMVAVNAVGDIYDPRTAQIIAGARAEGGKGFRNTIAQIHNGYRVVIPENGTNTTIGVVATNAKLNKDQATKIAQMAHDGYARAINPTHTPWDGDTIFSLATGTIAARVEAGAIGALAADVMAQAIVRAITQAEGIPSYPSYRDLHK